MKIFIIQNCFDSNSTPNVVPTKEHPDNSNVNASEFNPAYSVEITNAKTQGEVDTFDHILQVTSHHEAVVAYYYMDDDNKVRTPNQTKKNGLKFNLAVSFFFQVKFTKIFDLTDDNSTNDGEQLKSEWDTMPTTGTNCHQCLSELFWESDVMPRCICFEINRDRKNDSDNSSTITNTITTTTTDTS